MPGARGGAPSRTSSMFVPIHSRVTVDDLLHGVIIQSANDACIALAEGIAGNEDKFARADDQAGARARPDQVDLRQLDRPARSQAADDRARARQARAPHHPDLSGLLQDLRRARIHLEQDPPVQPQSAAGHEYRRRRSEDRLHQGGRLRSRRLGGAERICA